MKEGRPKRLYTLCFHVYEEYTKSVYSDRKQIDDRLELGHREWGSMAEGYQGSFWCDGSALNLDCGIGHMDVKSGDCADNTV